MCPDFLLCFLIFLKFFKKNVQLILMIQMNKKIPDLVTPDFINFIINISE